MCAESVLPDAQRGICPGAVMGPTVLRLVDRRGISEEVSDVLRVDVLDHRQLVVPLKRALRKRLLHLLRVQLVRENIGRDQLLLDRGQHVVLPVEVSEDVHRRHVL